MYAKTIMITENLFRLRRLLPYEEFIQEEMILRDLLAADRTILANERTLLGYIRTALTLIVVGLSLMKFFSSDLSLLFGLVVCMSGVGLFVIGYVRYKEMKKMINSLRVRKTKIDQKVKKVDIYTKQKV